ncbi:MAG TPA: hypothetical protein VFM25_10910 [Verrucomicrobiae bacterium]|nr:hypothetical protein [Verrucomicrobiae bacterium]
MLFISALFVFFGMLIVAYGISRLHAEKKIPPDFLYFPPGAFLVLAAWLFARFSRARVRRPKSYKFPPLSCDEMRAARSKLMTKKKA